MSWYRDINKNYCMMKKIGGFCVLFFLFLPGQIFADEQVAIGVYPPRIVIDALPKQQISVPILIENFSTQTQTIAITYREISPQKNGTVLYRESSEAFLKLQPFLTITEGAAPVKTITLAPQQKKQLHFSAVTDRPIDADFSVIFTTQPDTTISQDTTETTSFVSLGIATNVFLSIGEKRPAALTLTAFDTPIFTESGPIGMTAEVTNHASQRTSVSGVITFTNMFGQRIGKLTLPPTLILKESARLLTAEESDVLVWPEKALLGWYTATMTLSVAGGNTFTRDIHFLVFPLRITAGFFFGILLLLIILTRIRKKLREV